MTNNTDYSRVLIVLAAMFFVLLLNGCATPTKTAMEEVAPKNLRMIILPGAEHNSRSIMFRTNGSKKLAEPSESTESGEPNAAQGDNGETPIPPFAPDGVDVLFPATPAPQIVATENVERVQFHARSYVDYQSEISLHMGYRQDNLKWNIADLGGTPNIFSELEWEDMQSMELSAEFRWSNDSMIYLRGGVRTGWILEGDNQDSDYLGDDRTLEFSRSNNAADGGGLLDASMGIGYRFSLPLSQAGAMFHIMPLVGYSYHGQDLEISEGNQTLSEYGFSVPLGSFDDLGSLYTAQWGGFWVGFDTEFVLNVQHKLLASFEYHWADYEGEADWNLRDEFLHPKSFEHTADGRGFVASLNWQYQPSSSWFCRFGLNYQKWTTESGDDTVFFADGSEVSGRLNEVDWDSFSINFGVGYSFK